MSQLDIIKQGVDVWNKWREENPDITISLCKIDLSGLDLSGINLRDADMRGANLSGCNLSNADLRGINLSPYMENNK